MPKKEKKHLSKFTKHFIKNLKIFILSIWVIMVWRWVWNLLDHYFLPDMFLLSNILVIIVWILILFLNNFDLDELH